MPNWCFTYYAVEGPMEQLQKLSDLMNHVASMPRPGLVENDFGSSWLGNLVTALGVDPLTNPNLRCRGEYYNVDLNQSGYMTFDTMTAWCEADGTRHLIEEKFPGVHIYFISEDFGCHYWETNDVEGKYFSERYYFRAEDFDDEHDGNYYDTLPELVEAVEKATGESGLQTFEDCEKALQEHEDGNYAYALYRVSFENQGE